MRKTRKLLGAALCAVMLVSLLPGMHPQVKAEETADKMTIEIGGAGIANGSRDDKKWDYVYYGTYEENPIKWRVLSKNGSGISGYPATYKTATDTPYMGDAMFLLSEHLLQRMAYEAEGSADDGDGQKIPASWQHSDAYKWATDTFAKNAFSSIEQNYILKTSKYEKGSYVYELPWEETTLTDDTFFFLSSAESEAFLSLNDDSSLCATDIDGDSTNWWLRSKIAQRDNQVGNINGDRGEAYYSDVNVNYFAARPAFNLEMRSILFASPAKEEKNDGLSTVETYDGDEWKLTILDKSRKDFDVSLVEEGGKTYIAYSGAMTGANEYISAILVDEEGRATQYGRLARVTAPAGRVEFDISAIENPEQLYIFNEQVNGDFMTDYSSRFLPLSSKEAKQISDTGSPYYGYYEIRDTENLLWFAKQVGSGRTDINAVLVNDIHLPYGAGWTPIGNAENKFSGIFDGAGHSISSLDFDVNDSFGGLFGYISSATVKNLSAEGAMRISCTEADKEHFGLIGYADGESTVADVHSNLSIFVKDALAKKYIGGVIGRADGEMTVERCAYSGTMELGTANADCAGGIVAHSAAGAGLTISDCGFYGTINSACETPFRIGGIMGYYNGDTTNGANISIKNCLSVGTIHCAQSALCGAFMGVLNNVTAENAGNFSNNYCKSSSTDIGEKPAGVSNAVTAADEAMLKSGEIAYGLGTSWGQTIGTEHYPVLGGAVVCQNLDEGTYMNVAARDFLVVSSKADGARASALVHVPIAGTYTVIFADYENGELRALSTATEDFAVGATTVTSETDISFNIGDRIFIWHGAADMRPVGKVFVLSSYTMEYISGTAGHAGEGGDKLLDGDVNTKWCSNAKDHAAVPYVIFKFAYPVCIQSYTLTTANDAEKEPARNWTAWTLYGSDGETGPWEELHKVEGASLPDTNLTESAPFIIENNQNKYNFYKLEVNGWESDALQQMAEFTPIVE